MSGEMKHHGVKGMKWGVRRYQNADGSLTPAGKKKNDKEADKEISKRNTDLFLRSNNYAANKINGKWLDDFNKKWEKEFKDYSDWQDSPKYAKYEKAYDKNRIGLMDQFLKNDPKAKFTTKMGQTYTARFLEEYGQQVVWGTSSQWAKKEDAKRVIERGYANYAKDKNTHN